MDWRPHEVCRNIVSAVADALTYLKIILKVEMAQNIADMILDDVVLCLIAGEVLHIAGDLAPNFYPVLSSL